MGTASPVGPKQELGHLLTQQGLLTPGQLSLALRHQREGGKPLGQVIVDLGLVAEEDVTRARAQQVDLPYVRVQDMTVEADTLALVDAAIARKFLLLPVGRTPDGTLKLIVAGWNAHIMDVAAKVAARHRLRIAPALATEAQVRAAIDLYYGQEVPAEAPTLSDKAPPRSPIMGGARGDTSFPAPPIIGGPGGPLPRQGASADAALRHATPALLPDRPAVAAPPALVAEKRASDVFSSHLPATAARGNRPDEIDGTGAGVDQPVVIQFVNKILADAISRGASDIHFEPRRDALDIRYRIDGTLQDVDSVKREFQSACASRIKIMAEMNIAERRLPQDGRIAVTTEGRSVDMRVSSLPTQFGESVVLRILDKTGVRPQLDQLGFSERNLHTLNSLIRKPHGIFLATGPTGSGKTTTLYSAIQAIHTPDVNIITVEDPIEYELDGIRQSNVNEKAGLTFARQLRAILRQDPDIIYVGEIRDAETAEIAFRAALTGHLVFSTLHCNDAAGAVTRLLNMNVDPFLVASTVVGVLAQRLVRRVCSKCAEPAPPSDTDLAAFGLGPETPGFYQSRFVQGAGCEFCAFTGYKGRYSVQELMTMDDAIRAMTLQRVPSTKIRRAAIARGMISMRQDAAAKIMQGVTTFEEAQKRVYIEEDTEETARVF